MRDYARIAPTFWTRGSGKRLRGCPEAQVVALYLMSSPSTNMVGIFHLALPTLLHETGLTAEAALKGLARCAEEDLAHWDESEELVFIPALARHQLGERMSAGKNGKPDNKVHAIKKALAPFKGHRFYDLFLDRYAEAYLLTELFSEGSSEAASQGPSKGPRARVRDPAPAPAPELALDPEGESEGEESVMSTAGVDAPLDSLRTALTVPIQQRSQSVLRRADAADWCQPDQWPEVREAIVGIAPGARLGVFSRDPGVRAVVTLLGAGYQPTEIVRAAQAAKRSAWWTRDGKVRGISDLSPEVVRRALAESPPSTPRTRTLSGAEGEAEILRGLGKGAA